MPTYLVGTDLTRRSLPAIVRGMELARVNGGRLIVCHATETALPVVPLFPQETGARIVDTVSAEQSIAEAVTQQVLDATGSDAFDVVVDIGEPPRVMCTQATRHHTHLVIVTADRPGVGMVARNLSTSPCSVLIVGSSVGTAAAIFTLESEIELLGPLVEAVRAVSIRPVSKFVIVLQSDSEEKKAPVLAEIERTSRSAGVPFEPWFADFSDPLALAHAASDPEIGLVARAAPPPDKIVGQRASPFDDAFDDAQASLLLIRW